MTDQANDMKTHSAPKVNQILSADFFTVKPISTDLQTKSAVPVCSYATGKGLDCSNPRLLHLEAIDLDIWAEDSLNAIDAYLNPQFAEAVVLVDRLQPIEEQAFLKAQGIAADSFLTAMLYARDSLANTISDLVVSILISPPVAAEALQKAKDTYKQQLLLKLGAAYFVDTLIQTKVSLQVEDSSSPEAITPPTVSVASIDGGSISGISLSQQGTAQADLYDMSFFLTVHNKEDNSSVAVIIGQPAQKIQVPIDLRTYPPLTSLSGQNGITTPSTSKTTKEKIEAALIWDYSYAYTALQGAQDQMYSRIEFNTNTPPPPFSGSVIATQKLFDDLAQFDLVREEVINDLTASLKALTPTTPITDPNVDKAYFAIEALVQLSNNLANSWASYKPVSENTTQAQATTSAYDFIIAKQPDPDFLTTYPSDNGGIPRLLVSIVPADKLSKLDKTFYPLENLPVESLPNIPVIGLEGYEYENATNIDGSQIPGSYWYYVMNGAKKEYLSFYRSSKVTHHSVTLKGLDLLKVQSVCAAWAVIRNEHLISTSDTASALAYHSPLVSFADSFTPSFSDEVEIDISKLTNEAGSQLALVDHLSNVFGQILKDESRARQDIKLGINWLYTVSADEGSPSTFISLPVFLSTDISLQLPEDYQVPTGGCSDIASTKPFVCAIAKAMKAWYANTHPPLINASFQFDLTLFANDEPASTLIRLTNLVLPSTAITDL